MLGPCEGKSVRAVVVHQLRDAGEDAATLIQSVAQAFAALRLGHDDVHATLTGPDKRQECNIVSSKGEMEPR